MSVHRRAGIWLTIACLVLPVTMADGHQPGEPRAVALAADDYPPLDMSEWRLVNRGLVAQAAARALSSSPTSLETLELLAQAGRTEDALGVIDRIVHERPDLVAPAFAVVEEQYHRLLNDGSRDYGVRMQGFLTLAVDSLRLLDAEEAAETAFQLARVQNRLRRDSSEGYRARVEGLIREYDGTEVAQLAHVELVSWNRNVRERLDALDAVVAANPGTTAAARALFLKGRSLRTDGALARGSSRTADPTRRFLEVAAIVEDLESGRYPPSEWVDTASQLLIDFWASDEAVYAPANLARMLAVYRVLAERRFELDPEAPLEAGVGRVVAGKMAPLIERRDGFAGVEAEFDRLAQVVADVDAVRYLQALWVLDRADESPTADRPALVGRAVELLEPIAERGGKTRADSLERRALATLAAQHFHEGEVATALPLYSRYLAAHAESGWAWVASLRVGQAYEALGETESAVEAYRSAAATYGELAPAAVLGHALAAGALIERRRLAEGLAEYRLVARAWDHDFGREYHTFSRAVANRAWKMRVVDQPSLALSIHTAAEALMHPGGELLEAGRWLLSRDRPVAARSALEDFLAANPESPLASEAHYLAHRARLEVALPSTDSQPSTEEGIPSPLAELEKIASDPWDPAVGVAQIARATHLWRRGAGETAEQALQEALETWNQRQHRGVSVSPTDLDADVASIRALLFRPLGGGIFAEGRWNGFRWPERLPHFMIVDPELTVQLWNRDRVTVTLAGPIEALEHVLFMNTAQLRLLNRVIEVLGGTDTQEPSAPWQVPNQPVGGSVAVLELWKKFFPARPGHWFGWVFRTYPIIRQIDFLDEARTEARAYVTIGYAGATVVLRKRAGIWTAVALTNHWVT